MCMIDGADPWDFYSSSDPVARIEHECGECRRTIEPGEKYHRAIGKLDGYIDTFKVCRHCLAAAKWLSIVCDGWLYNGIQEELFQHWDDEPEYRSFWLGRRIVEIRRKWRRPNGEMYPPPAPPVIPKELLH